MPQSNVIPNWKATYPYDAPSQKSPTVTPSTTLGANAVPNKPNFAAGTIQMAAVEAEAEQAEPAAEPAAESEPETAQE